MWLFLLKRVLHMIPLLLGVSLLTFLLMAMAPGDYYTALQQNPQITPEKLAELRAKRHFDKPWYIQYGYWLKDAAHGDLGYSIAYQAPVTDLIKLALPNTFILSFAATVLTWLIALPLGIFAAVYKDSWIDRCCALFAFLGLSVPEIMLSLLALMFAAATGWFPTGSVQSAFYDVLSPSEQFRDRLHHLILPMLVLTVSSLAGIMRQMRSSLLEILRAEYVTTARAKGLANGWVICKHALRNAINPLLTIFGYSLAGLLSGAFIVENIMSWPGLGRLAMNALTSKDYPLVVATVVMSTGLLVVGNFIADVLLAWSDPRIRIQS